MSDATPFLLEQYFSEFQGDCEINIGSSGCAELSVSELLTIAGSTPNDLGGVVFRDADPSGELAMRALIAEQYVGASHDDILATHGSSEALYLAMACLLHPGDRVVVQSPCYQSLSELPRMFGAVVDECPMWNGLGFQFPVETICKRIKAGAKMVIINSPHNPTGATLQRDELEDIANCADLHGTWLVLDDAFVDIVFDGAELGIRRLLTPRCLRIGTLSKSFGLTGLRVGWCVGPHNVLKKMLCRKHYVTINACPLVERLAILALQSRDTILDRHRAQVREGLAALTSWIEGQLEWTPPKGGVCCYPRLPVGVSSRALCIALAKRHRVFAVPGSVFGDDGHIRIGFGGGSQDVARGIEALSTELQHAVATRGM
jgi:aspartate/methionine/tyrosine aminotransferase